MRRRKKTNIDLIILLRIMACKAMIRKSKDYLIEKESDESNCFLGLNDSVGDEFF